MIFSIIDKKANIELNAYNIETIEHLKIALNDFDVNKAEINFTDATITVEQTKYNV